MEQRTEYRNDSPGVAGAVVIENGKARGIPVAPGDTIWLTDEDKIATANAPKKDSDNPLVNGTFTLVTEPQDVANRRPLAPGDQPPSAVEPPAAPPAPEPPATEAEKAAQPEDAPAPPPAEDVKATEKAKAEEQAKRDARAKAQAEAGVKPVDETGAAVPAQGLPHQGSRKTGEEVATPTAPAKAGTKSG